ncbi:hypothetical protein MKEN_01323000 [Mycena kentingensis (nom. inval.)]|nr:hypothetical protein MKEN_01323000 [Mycena kentingensis (nom. inval.)]
MLFSIVSSLAAASAVSAAIVNIAVGGPGGAPTFTPNTVTANEGDQVVFTFNGVPGNHSVTQSTLAKPCEAAPGGFDSGWVQIGAAAADPFPTFSVTIGAAAADPFPTFSVTVTNASAPIWFYCKQLNIVKGPKPHCEMGMVGVINIGTKDFSSWAQVAEAATVVGQAQGGFSGVNAAATAYPVAAGSAQSVIIGPSDAAPAAGGSPSQSGSAPPATETKGAATSVSARIGGTFAAIVGFAGVAMLL